MRILFVASEVVPFVKTGGLADVAGALPKALHERGHDVRVVLPRYGDIESGKFRLLPMMPEMKVRYDNQTVSGSILRCSFPGTNMPVYFVDEPMFSMRKGIYGNGKADFTDNDLRFAVFSMACLWLLKGLDWQPDIIHVNDWQTGLIPALLRHHPEIAKDPFYAPIRTVFSVHNLVYQGNFDKYVVPGIGLPWEVFTQEGMEFYGKASFLKAGLSFSDEIVAVSPTYAREIQTEELGAGMDGTLQNRADHIHGILNGIDATEWNPERDAFLAAPFTAETLEKKAECKADLQKTMGLPVDPKVPVLGMITRLVAQKGIDLLVKVLGDVLELDAQLVILGTGDPTFETALQQAAAEAPTRLAVRIDYNNALSHKIIGGADMFLMPSHFEPCGLTQFYSMRYGTVPVVRSTGGLADSVDATTGFEFADYTPAAFVKALTAAVATYRNKPDAWKKLQLNGMAKDFSWKQSAGEYEKLYEEAVKPIASNQPGGESK